MKSLKGIDVVKVETPLHVIAEDSPLSSMQMYQLSGLVGSPTTYSVAQYKFYSSRFAGLEYADMSPVRSLIGVFMATQS